MNIDCYYLRHQSISVDLEKFLSILSTFHTSTINSHPSRKICPVINLLLPILRNSSPLLIVHHKFIFFHCRGISLEILSRTCLESRKRVIRKRCTQNELRIGVLKFPAIWLRHSSFEQNAPCSSTWKRRLTILFVYRLLTSSEFLKAGRIWSYQIRFIACSMVREVIEHYPSQSIWSACQIWIKNYINWRKFHTHCTNSIQIVEMSKRF